MSLTAFNRIRRIQQVEEMKPENIQKAKEEKSIVPEVVEENNFKDEPLVPEVEEKSVEKTKTATRRNSSKK